VKAGWEIKTLGDICIVDWGNTDLTKASYVEGGKYLAVSAAGCDGRIGHKEHLKNTPVLSAIGAQCGKMFLPDEDFTAIKNTITLTPRNGTCTGQFLYQLLTHVDLPKRGAAQPFIAKGDILNFSIIVPPLPEQQRIVGILDEAFAAIASAKAKAEQNLKNARALFESHLNEVFTQRGEGWVEKRLSLIAEVQSGGTPSVPEKTYWGGIIPWYSSGELNETYTIAPERTITNDGLSNSNAKLFPKGSLLIGMYDTAALKMSILDRDGAFNQAIAGVKPNENLDLEFVLHAINAIKPYLLLERRGVRQKNLSLGKIKDISIPLPPVSEQRAVVARLSDFSSDTRRLESLYQRKIEELDALKKSLLEQAFKGEL
jgi:type I restriction enzyme S subunit